MEIQRVWVREKVYWCSCVFLGYRDSCKLKIAFFARCTLALPESFDHNVGKGTTGGDLVTVYGRAKMYIFLSAVFDVRCVIQ